MQTSELKDLALDWAVAHADGKNGVLHDDGITRCIVIAAPSGVYKGTWKPTINWSQGGPIIEREGMQLQMEDIGEWHATMWWDDEDGQKEVLMSGPTPLIAAMRCYVASVLGKEVDIPEELQ